MIDELDGKGDGDVDPSTAMVEGGSLGAVCGKVVDGDNEVDEVSEGGDSMPGSGLDGCSLGRTASGVTLGLELSVSAAAGATAALTLLGSRLLLIVTD